MPQSLAQIYIHLVFSTKDRKPLLADDSRRDDMHRILGGICGELESPVLRVGGVADHVHLLCRLGRTITVGDLVQGLKRRSTLWINETQPASRHFHWQNGYAAFSISPGDVDKVTHYIDTQEEHHRTVTFQDELRRILTIYGLEWDERYVWD